MDSANKPTPLKRMQYNSAKTWSWRNNESLRLERNASNQMKPLRSAQPTYMISVRKDILWLLGIDMGVAVQTWIDRIPVPDPME